MADIGYHLSSEEHPGPDLVGYARRAEEVGFSFALISDHFHPWTRAQGHAPLVWAVLGAIAQVTSHLRVGTGVTAPIIRIHPALVAQASATVATLMPGRFVLGVGTGENLNEHIVGEEWPPSKVRLAMLGEAIDVIRKLWGGTKLTLLGEYYRVEEAQLFEIPDPLPEILVSAGGKKSAKLAGQKGDGLISVFPDQKVLAAFDEAGGSGKGKYFKLAVCFDRDEVEARRIAHEYWPLDALEGRLGTELKTPKDFESASKPVTEEQAANKMLCSADPEVHAGRIKELLAQGFDHVYIHQIGPNQEQFFQFYEAEVLPQFTEVR